MLCDSGPPPSLIWPTTPWTGSCDGQRPWAAHSNGQAWSQHTVEPILTNRVYIGGNPPRHRGREAQTPIVDASKFNPAQRILGKRSADIGQRAANPGRRHRL
jgi:hypothetical protein